MSDRQRLKVNGKEYEIARDWTLGEMCDAERFFGVQFGENGAGQGVRVTAALLYVSIRRADPTVTIDDIRAIPQETLRAVNKELGEGTDVGPPEPTEEPSEPSGFSGEASSNGGADIPELDPSRIGAPT